MRPIVTLLLLLGALLAEHTVTGEEVKMKKLTPILVVDAIEPSLGFWVDRLGFQKIAEVQDGENLGFVILARDGMEVMYQTRASIDKEVASEGLHEGLKSARGPSILYVEVADLEEIRAKSQGMEILVPYRETFYGAKEMWLREPGGHIIGLAAMGKQESH